MVVALYAAAVYLAVDRVRLLRTVGVAVVVAGVVTLLIRGFAVRTAVSAAVQTPSQRPTATTTVLVATELLGQLAWVLVVYGLVIALFAAALGTSRAARAVRQSIAPALNVATPALAAGVVVFLLLLAWWSPGRVFDGWLRTVFFVALVIGAVVALRARTLVERPDATFDPWKEKLSTAWRATTSLVQGSTRNRPSDDLAARLESLQQLHADGVIDDDELATARRAVLTDA